MDTTAVLFVYGSISIVGVEPLFEHDPGAGIPIPSFCDKDLLFDPLLQLAHMGDDSNQSVGAGEVRQGGDGLAQGFLVQGAEALVHEHGVEPDAAGLALDHFRESQCQGQGGLEALSAGESSDTSDRAVVMIHDVQFQTGELSPIGGLGVADQFVLAVGHPQEPGVGAGDDPVEVGGLELV